jgi:putative phosphoesterase
VIADTHGLVRPEAKALLSGCDHILHGGDITGPEVLEALATIAPVTAVRGNNDKGSWAQRLNETELVKFGELWIYVTHDLSQHDLDLGAAGIDVVVSGHSHKPKIEKREGVLFVNPGSAGPRRFKLPVSMAELTIDGGAVTARIIELGS